MLPLWPMTAQSRAAVWLDHHEARVFHVDLAGFDERTLQAPEHRFHRHPKGPSEPRAHPADETHFFEAIARSLASAEQVLLLGPSTAHAQFLKYLETHARPLAAKVVGVETSDHPTDAQLVQHVRGYFRIPEPRVR
jgi:stalled ribosome rescue protein Dom34